MDELQQRAVDVCDCLWEEDIPAEYEIYGNRILVLINKSYFISHVTDLVDKDKQVRHYWDRVTTNPRSLMQREIGQRRRLQFTWSPLHNYPTDSKDTDACCKEESVEEGGEEASQEDYQEAGEEDD